VPALRHVIPGANRTREGQIEHIRGKFSSGLTFEDCNEIKRDKGTVLNKRRIWVALPTLMIAHKCTKSTGGSERIEKSLIDSKNG